MLSVGKFNGKTLFIYLYCNQKTRLFNKIISFVALKIYKYKMFCRLECLNETEYNLRNHVIKCTIFWINVLKSSKCDWKCNTTVIRLSGFTLTTCTKLNKIKKKQTNKKTLICKCSSRALNILFSTRCTCSYRFQIVEHR